MTPLRLPPGRIVDGRFTIQAELGRGPTCVTYRAITAPNREVALRLLDPSVPNAERMADALRRAHAGLPEDLERFVVHIVDGGRDAESNAPFFVAPIVSTPSLAQLVSLCPFEAVDAATTVLNLGRALDAMHLCGVAHLALKPNNVFVGPAPERMVRLTDPHARLLRLEPERDLRWIAPEQVGSAPAGPAADVFVMALVAFYSLTGASLLSGSPDVNEWRSQLAKGMVASARARELGVALRAEVDPVFRRALALAPDQRPPTAGAFAQALAEALAPGASSSAVLRTPVPLPAAAPAPPLAAAEQRVAEENTWPLAGSPSALAHATALRSRPERASGWHRRAFAVGAGCLVVTLVIGILAVRTRFGGTPAPVAASTSGTAAREPPVRSVSDVPSFVPPAASKEEPAPAAPATPPPTLAKLGPRQAELTILCEPVSCTNVMLDGKPMTQYPAPAVVRAGAHGVGVSRPGYGGQWQRAVLAEGERKTVRFTMSPHAPAAQKQPCGKFLRRCD